MRIVLIALMALLLLPASAWADEFGETKIYTSYNATAPTLTVYANDLTRVTVQLAPNYLPEKDNRVVDDGESMVGPLLAFSPIGDNKYAAAFRVPKTGTHRLYVGGYCPNNCLGGIGPEHGDQWLHSVKFNVVPPRDAKPHSLKSATHGFRRTGKYSHVNTIKGTTCGARGYITIRNTHTLRMGYTLDGELLQESATVNIRKYHRGGCRAYYVEYKMPDNVIGAGTHIDRVTVLNVWNQSSNAKVHSEFVAD